MKPMGRRAFFTAGAGAAWSVASDAGAEREARVCREPAREIPIADEADVVVCGGGPAGIAAAITAGRMGASVRLIESNGCLGGVWTAGLLCWILDVRQKTGLIKEITDDLLRRNTAIDYGRAIGYDPEQMKLLLEARCAEAGVRFQFHTRVAAAIRHGDGPVRFAVTESKSGRQAWAGRVFIDTTGDGDLAALSGCGFDLGREGTGEMQPLSMIALLTGIDVQEAKRFVIEHGGGADQPHPKTCLREELERAGAPPSYSQPSLFYVRDGLFCFMANHEYGVQATDAAALTDATVRARVEVNRMIEGLRGLGGVWRGLQLVATPEHIGIREGRRIHGLATVTREDLIEGSRQPDAVCRVHFPVDVHSTDAEKTKGIMDEKVRAKPYDIPFRALVARDVDGLLMAGRCISGDFIAHSSYRVTGNAVPMGEAAGAAAALAAKTGRSPREIPWPEIQEAITRVQQT
jgi:hypothetical protein